MDKARKVIGVFLIASGAWALSCGGSGNPNELQQADIDAIASTLGSSFTSASGQSAPPPTGALTQSASSALTVSVPVNVTTNCPVSGHVTTAGSVIVTCPTPPATGSCQSTGAVTINYGDRTNNLNDCTYANGLVVDGSLYLTLSGVDQNITETLDGGLELNRKGSGGGLVPITINGIHTCFVFLTAKLPQRTLTGSICGRSVNRTF